MPRAAVAVLLLGVVALPVWWAARPAPGDAVLPAAEVRVGQAGWLVWWADGTLHLDGVVVDLPDVEQVVRGPSGSAVVVDGEGRVVRVRPDGARLLLGRTDEPGSLVASPDGRQLAWADGGRLVLAGSVDAVRGVDPREVLVDAGSRLRPVAVGQRRVWLAGDGRARALDLDTGGVESLGGVDLRALGGGRAVLALPDDSVLLAAAGTGGPLGVVSTIEPVGTRARVAPDGSTAVVLGDDGRAAAVTGATGDPLDTGLDPELRVVDATLGVDGRVAWVVARNDDEPGAGEFLRSSDTGAVLLLECRLAAPGAPTGCERLASVTGTAGRPLLAR